MQKIRKIVACIGGALICSALCTSAQQKSEWIDLHFVRQSEAWLTGVNPAGLKYTPVDTISEIRFTGDFSNGTFINYNQPTKSQSLGGLAESYFRLNNRVVLWGSINYTHFAGKNMGASAWIDPEQAPFNLIEYADTTRGDKSMETYHLSGAVAIDLNKRLTFGGNIDYQAANYVKKRDLRHLNTLMNLDLSLGTIYEIGAWAQVGFIYNYRKRIEETNFDTFGNTDRTYSTLISWGTFWGPVEGFGDEGFTGKNDNNPLVDKINGLSLQLNLHISPNLSFYNQISINKREGYFGIRSDQTRVYTEHNAKLVAYRGRLSHRCNNTLHLLNILLHNNTLKNWKTNYYFNHDSESGTTYVRYNTPTKVLVKTNLLASMEYQLHLGYQDFNPAWSIMIRADYRSREQKVSIYPFYRNQSINQFAGKLNIKRNITSGKNQYSFLLGGRYSTGDGTALDAGNYAGSTDNTTNYRSTNFNLYREYEYLTSTCITTHTGFKYTRLFKQKKIRAFSEIRYEWTKATDVEYIKGNTFNSISLSMGFLF